MSLEKKSLSCRAAIKFFFLMKGPSTVKREPVGDYKKGLLGPTARAI